MTGIQLQIDIIAPVLIIAGALIGVVWKMLNDKIKDLAEEVKKTREESEARIVRIYDKWDETYLRNINEQFEKLRVEIKEMAVKNAEKASGFVTREECRSCRESRQDT